MVLEALDMYNYFILNFWIIGREFAKHKKNHRYSIVNEEFSVFGDSWTAVEEHKLLEALLQKG